MAEPVLQTSKDDTNRQELIEKLNKDFDEYLTAKLDNSKKNPKNDKPKETLDDILAELDRHPAFMKEIKPEDMNNSAVQALMNLKYNTEDALENAQSFKEEGNRNFKFKKYRWAIDNYTAGIREKCSDRELNAILFSNRAAANFNLGNFGSALKDALASRKFKNNHMKAIIKGGECCFQLKKYEEAIKWCNYGILIEPSNEKLKLLLSKSEILMKQENINKKKELAMKTRNLRSKIDLVKIIMYKGIHLSSNNKLLFNTDEDIIENLDLESCHPGVIVSLDSNNSFVWPVMFLYPEYGQSDFIQKFNENETFEDHLKTMFDLNSDPVSWDEEQKYISSNLSIFFENRIENTLHFVKKSSRLIDTLKLSNYVVDNGTPVFLILPKNSDFTKHFVEKYKR